jgi:hypothetical protein
MSLNLVKKNSSSPFQLQRSIVDQGGEGGAYESGGFNPDMVYNNDAANAAVESFGKVVGAALSARGKDKEKFKKPELPKETAAEDASSWEDYKVAEEKKAAMAESKKQEAFQENFLNKLKNKAY